MPFATRGSCVTRYPTDAVGASPRISRSAAQQRHAVGRTAAALRLLLCAPDGDRWSANVGIVFTLIMGLICGASSFFMDLDAKSDFFSLFLPFAFVVSGLVCFVAIAGWFFRKFGAPSSIDSSSG